MEYPNFVVEFYFNDVYKCTIGITALNAEKALIKACNELAKGMGLPLVNNYIIYDIEKEKTVAGDI